jgi:hypothetical protein
MTKEIRDCHSSALDKSLSRACLTEESMVFVTLDSAVKPQNDEKQFLDSGSLAQTVIKQRWIQSYTSVLIVIYLLFIRKSHQGGQVRNDQ